MVTCAALTNPPMMASKPMIGSVGLVGLIVMDRMTRAPMTAPPLMASIEVLDPKRAMARPPVIAPTTPPRFHAVIPVLATVESKPAPVNSEGIQLKPEYTAKRQKKKALHKATVSNGDLKIARIGARATALSARSTNPALAAGLCPMRWRMRTSSGHRFERRAR